MQSRANASTGRLRRGLMGLVLALLGGVGMLASYSPAQEAQGDLVVVVELEDAIGPASASYFIDSLEEANERGATLLVLRLDTPGGLDAAMRDMIKAILASEVPVATWVAPSGARAASAGTYIMYASHFALMAAATNIGSSTPVNLTAPESPSPTPRRFPNWGGGDEADEEEESEEQTAQDDTEEAMQDASDGEGDGEDESAESVAEEDDAAEVPQPSTTMERKVVNDAVAYIRGLAELRERNADWAEDSVREAVNLPSSEALEQGVIDFVAQTLDELIEQVNGEEFKNASGEMRVLAVADPIIERVTPDWRVKFLAVITNPSVAVLLLSLGSLALAAEFYTGTGVAGVVGAICLIVAAYGMQMLPINLAGLALLVVGLGLMIAEFFTPSIGIFGFGGAVAFVFGGIFLLDTDAPGFNVSIGLLIGIAAVFLIMVAIIGGAAFKSLRSKVVSGTSSMIGEEVEAISAMTQGDKGKVIYGGELWNAVADSDVQEGDTLKVTAVSGLTLTVQGDRESP